MTKIQRDPARCWVRVDTEDEGSGLHRTLIGDAWQLEPFGTGQEEDEFSLTVTSSRSSSGMRLNRDAGAALRDALNEWLAR